MGQSQQFTSVIFSSRGILAVITCVCYMLVSSGLIVLNKYLMSDDGFHFPATLSGQGMVFSAVLSFLICKVFKLVEAKQQVSWSLFVFNLVPVGFFSSSTLFFGNWVYLFLSVSFIQMLKAFCPIIVMCLAFVARLETPSQRLIGSVCVIVSGTLLSSLGEANFNIPGIIVMFMAEFAEGMRLILAQYLLTNFKFHPLEGLMYQGSASAVWLLLGVSVFELPRILKENAFEIVMRHPWLYFLAGTMGFMVNTLAYFVIQLTSSLTLKVLSSAKNAAVILFSVVFMGEQVAMIQLVGYITSLAGFAWYNYVKIQDATNKKSRTKSEEAPDKEMSDEKINSAMHHSVTYPNLTHTYNKSAGA
eukprot:TRINITY_DN1962_c0_g1_i6.p1 TRINITY_DN1962_c0_g1~~TRINITY_DN1962_c0_g1_i6.p1  ORF type:complete len:388 (-),score=39.75 TRINITY_DN1962_c0_g1_i6:574-1653(-)